MTCEIWRSPDGTTWSQVNTNVFGESFTLYDGIAVFNNYLYVGTSNYYNGGEIWRTQDGAIWERVSNANDGFGDVNINPAIKSRN